MPLIVRIVATCFVVAFSTFTTLDAGVVRRGGGGVVLVGPVERVSVGSVSPALAKRISRLADIDPAHPITDDTDTQTLSLFGREDLIAGVSKDYRPTRCTALPSVPSVLDAIVSAARRTSIVIVNESHERSQHRGFIAQVAARLRPLGYDTLAIETLSNWSADTPVRYRPSLATRPGLSYLEDGDGYYLSEAGFGRLGRRAKALGYRLLPYEPIPDAAYAALPPDGQIAAREEGQASALAAFLRDHPRGKLLIHVGYSHAAEVPRADGARWMAARLKEKTGVDPLTISQTTCRGGGDTVHLAALPADQPPGTFDLIVDHPTSRFVRGRPEWRQWAGDRAVSIPRALRPASGWRVVEARPLGESVSSIPLDRVAIRPGEDVALMLPPGRYQLRAIEPPKTGKAQPAPGD